MTEFQVAGTMDSALSHFALVGLAAIIEDQTGERPRIQWTEEWPAHPVLACRLTPDAIAETVQSHAQAHCEPDSWVSLRVYGGPRDGGGLFTARATRLTQPAQWRDYTQQRRRALESQMLLGAATQPANRSVHMRPRRSRSHTLDAAMLLALGESAWWLEPSRVRRPDDGASRWEMKTRNRGEEVIRDRLSPLAAIVAAHGVPQIVSGLTGLTIIDEASKGRADPRSSTGLTTPRPTDNVLAWCALWGLSTAPTIARLPADTHSRGMSQSPGVWPQNVVHPTHFAVPVFTRATTVGRWGAILTSRQFSLALAAAAEGSHNDEAQGWLTEQGVRALALFPSRVVGSANAPERQLLTGEVHPL